MRDVKRQLSSLDRIEPPDVWERAASREPSTEPYQDETVTSPWKRATAVVVAFAVFGAAALLAIRAFDRAPTDRAPTGGDSASQRSATDDVRGIWQALPEGPLSPRYAAFAFWVDGRIVVIGGLDSQPCPPTANCGVPEPPLRDGAAYEPLSGTWTTIARSPVPIAYSTGAVLGDTIYLWVSWQPLGPGGTSFLSYDVNQDRWEELPMPPRIVPAGRLLSATDGAVVVYPDSQERGGFFRSPLRPLDGRMAGASTRSPRPLVRQVEVWTGAELLLLGLEDVGVQQGSGDVYRAAALDISSGTWRRLPDSGIAGYNPTWFWSAGRAVNPTIGRVGDADPLRHPYGGMFDPTTGSWSDLPEPPTGLHEYGGPSVGGSEHVVSWQGAILDVAAGSWSALPATPMAADDGAAVVWAGDRLVVWGGYAWKGPKSVPDPLNAEATLLSTGWSWKP